MEPYPRLGSNLMKEIYGFVSLETKNLHSDIQYGIIQEEVRFTQNPLQNRLP